MEVHLINSSYYDANAYLVVAPRPVLIDVGMDGRYVVEKISDLLDPARIETIILTHGHFDHWGGVEAVRSAFQAVVAIHADEAAIIADSASSAAAMFGFPAATLEPDRLLRGGDLVELGDGSALEVVHTPGHTPGGICLYHSPSKTLFSGDTVFKGGSFGRTDLVGGDQQTLVDSIKRLSEFDVDVLYPGHGDVVDRDASDQIKLSLQMAGTYL